MPIKTIIATGHIHHLFARFPLPAPALSTFPLSTLTLSTLTVSRVAIITVSQCIRSLTSSLQRST